MDDLKSQKIGDLLNFFCPALRLPKAVGSKDKGNSGIQSSLIIPLGVADIGGIGDMILLHQRADGLALRGLGIAVAEMACNIGGQTQLFHAELRITFFRVADNEQPVIFCKGLDGRKHLGIA